MRSRRVGVALALGLVALVAGGNRRAAAAPLEETPAKDLYLRHLDKIPGTVEAIANEAKRIGAKTVVVAFDRITFAPPPGEHEFNEEHAYARDLPAWMNALASCAAKHGLDIRAGGTESASWARLDDGAAVVRAAADLGLPTWTGPKAESAETASHWIGKALSKNGIAG